MNWTYIAGVHIFSMRFTTFLVSLLAVASAAQNPPAGSIVNAAESGDLAAVQEMLTDPHLSTKIITKALTSAAIAGHRQIVKVLLQDTRSCPYKALSPVVAARGMDHICRLLYRAKYYDRRFDLAVIQEICLSDLDEEQLDILTFRRRHDPATLAYLTGLQLARVTIPEALKPAFTRTLQILPGGGPWTIAAYRQLVRALTDLQLVVKDEGPMAFILPELVTNIAAHMLDK